MAGDGQRLRDALIKSLQEEPLLVDAEEFMHSAGENEMGRKFRGDLMQMLDEGPSLAEVDGLTYLGIERESVERFRTAMEGALRGGSRLASAEQEVLQSLGFEKLGEFRSKMRAHLDGPAEIPDEDLAIYVPAGEGRGDAFREALERQLGEIAVLPEITAPEVEEQPAPTLPTEIHIQPEVEVLPPEEQALQPWEPYKPQIEGEVEIPPASLLVITPESDVIEGVTEPQVKDRYKGLNPVPMLTAALEAAGVEGEDFGFLLRYGRYAPKGRKSEFIVGGLGLADLSNRLTSWLRAQGPMEAQVQVVDEGSGELTIYLLAPEDL
jgi:hypothetical protein